MKYKGLLIDIDNTLYDYQTAHEAALANSISWINAALGVDKEKVVQAYNFSRKKVHMELNGTAASHNRMLYFQYTLELLGQNSLQYSINAYEIYWQTFLDRMVVFEGVYDLLERYKGAICFVTDLTAHIQHRKMMKLNLFEFAKFVVTSEESGAEKPHPYIFLKSLQKLNLKESEVCMIGDNFKKDIIGASMLGIRSVWLNRRHEVQTFDPEKIIEVKSFHEILTLV